MSKEKTFINFIKNGNSFMPNHGKMGSADRLPPGVYTFDYSQEAKVFVYELMDTTHDNLLDLPSPEFKQVVGQFETFLKPETRRLYDQYGFLYKRSALLYGAPGTGKTCIVDRVSDHVVKLGGVVLFNPNPEFLQFAFQHIEDVQPDTTVMVIFEELDELMKRHESTLLNILDGEIQKANVMYVATTNHIDKIPPRIKRPGRFSSVIEVHTPSAEVRAYYLNIKLGNSPEVADWVRTTEGLTIDELKETVLAVKCLGEDLSKVVERVKNTRGADPSDEKEYEVPNPFGISVIKALRPGARKLA